MCGLFRPQPGVGQLESGHLFVHAVRRAAQKAGHTYQQGQELEHGFVVRRSGQGEATLAILSARRLHELTPRLAYEENWQHCLEPPLQSQKC